MRARNIKPGFFKNDRLAECDPLARILFAGLWCLADREGRLEDRPKRIKAETLPYDECCLDDLLKQLGDRGFIQRYEAEGGAYIQISNFSKHQNPHHREAESEIPPPPDQPGESPGQAQDKPGADPGKASEKPQPSRADSPSLIPDSPSRIPDSEPRRDLKGEAREVIRYLNEKTGRNFSKTDEIEARLKDGGTVSDCKQIIDTKVCDPHFQENPQYMNPVTLFRKSHWDKYLNQSPEDFRGGQKPHSGIAEWLERSGTSAGGAI